jgi:hypothetical protein
MKFKILSELTYEVYAPTTYIFNIQASNSNNQTILEESLSFSPELNFQEFTLPCSDSRYIKLQINYGTFTISYKALVEVNELLVNESTLLQEIPLFEMDNEVMTYISPSRHCESDKLIEFAAKEFGHLQDSLTKVKAIDNWIFNNVNYLTRSTNSSESACDTLNQPTRCLQRFCTFRHCTLQSLGYSGALFYRLCRKPAASGYSRLF